MALVPGAVSEAAGRLVEEARGSVVEVVSGGRGVGAGVIWPGEGLVLTNDHVLSGGVRGRRRHGNVRVALPDGRTFRAEVTKRDAGLDLALLRLDGPPKICRPRSSGTRTACGSESWSSPSDTRGGSPAWRPPAS